MGALSTQVLVTGADGFIGRNLIIRLRETGRLSVSIFLRGTGSHALSDLVAESDVVVHLAGENRPADERSFSEVNEGLTLEVCNAIRREVARSGKQMRILLASSAQAERDNPYGRSKLGAERAVQRLVTEGVASAVIYRLPGVFGKWCRPDYNSVVATFCHRIANGLPYRIDDPGAKLTLAYIDDVVEAFIAEIDGSSVGCSHASVAPVYSMTVGELAEQIKAFERSRSTLISERVGTGLTRALYSTFISYLPASRIGSALPRYSDPRGVFVEMLRTKDSGQFSYFTAHPGVTRGSHYHHTKTEKFLVIRGQALLRFRNLASGERTEIRVTGEVPQIVDSIPGWVHDITNVGDEELIVMLWANEMFDRDRPDTVQEAV